MNFCHDDSPHPAHPLKGGVTCVGVTHSILRLEDADTLGQLIRSVQAHQRIKWYQDGAADADHPVDGVLRHFCVDEAGNFPPHGTDVRDMLVRDSGLLEHFRPVRDVIRALQNIDGRYGLDEPIAIIEPR